MNAPSGLAAELTAKFDQRAAKAGVIGLGYVGLPLAIEMANAGFEVIGIDTDMTRVNAINAGQSYVIDIPAAVVKTLVRKERLSATNDYGLVKHLDAISICVPTPLRKTKDPDISFIVQAIEGVARHKRRGQLIVLESTTYPGTTEEILLPELQREGFTVGEDFFLAFSPERVDPGNQAFTTRNTPKIIGGVTPACASVARAFYRQFISEIIEVSSTQAAEMVKLLENTFRSVNIGLVNEMALMCDRLKLDVWEIIDAAASKPFGFMPFYPGPGLGGHCIPIDPHYLSWKLKSLNYQARFIELASEINTNMPHHVLNRLIDALNLQHKCLNGSKILVIGVAYKRDINDVRESPALDIMQLLKERHADLAYNDPYVPELTHYNWDLWSVPLDHDHLAGFDAAVIVTDHSCYDYEQLADSLPLIIDTRNATHAVTKHRQKIIKI